MQASAIKLLFRHPAPILTLFNVSFPGVFELALIRMSRYYDISSQTVLFDETLLPMEAFLTTRDTTEMKLVTEVFHFARDLAEMQLSEVALSLYSAYILLQEGEKFGL